MGFEPTVGFPTLDFESSALNRTQPPFHDKKNVEPAYEKSFGVASAERPTSNGQRKYDADDSVGEEAVVGHQRIATLVPASRVPTPASRARPWQTGLAYFTRAKNVTIFRLPCLSRLLHLVCPHGQPRYYLLLTAIDRLLAPLFTSIRTLFQTSTLPHRHDSIKTRNSACVTHFAVAIGRTPKKHA